DNVPFTWRRYGAANCTATPGSKLRVTPVATRVFAVTMKGPSEACQTVSVEMTPPTLVGPAARAEIGGVVRRTKAIMARASLTRTDRRKSQVGLMAVPPEMMGSLRLRRRRM